MIAEKTELRKPYLKEIYYLMSLNDNTTINENFI